MKCLLSLVLGLSLLVFIGCSGEEDNNPIEVTLKSSRIEFLEGDDTKTQSITVDFDEAAPVDMMINIEVSASSTLTVGEDYVMLDQTSFSLSSGESGFSLSLTILGDTIYEPSESLILDISSDYEAFTNASLQIVINNDDNNWNAGTFSIPTDGFETPLSYEGMDLVWQDEFEVDTLNTDNWSFETGDGCPNLCGWGNNELQFYSSANLSFLEGKLIISAKKEDVGGKPYTSSRINSKGKQSFKYGRIDIRAAMPYGKGLWPALWMLGENIDDVGWPACGEIDIMEMVGGSNGEDATTLGTVHWDAGGNHADYGGDYELSEGTLHEAFHVYSITWDEQYIRWYLDDIQYHEIDISPGDLSEFDEPFYFIFNVAVGGTLPGSPTDATYFPQYMIVDYVRVFQPN
jgi:beta-glucanase (GH16 family)